MMQEFMIGNTKIIINDSFCKNQTAEQREKIFQRVSDIAYKALLSQIAKRTLDEVGERT